MTEKAPSQYQKRQLSAAEIITDIASGSEFQRNRENGHGVERALARAALERAGMNPLVNFEDDYDPAKLDTTPEANLNRLVGTLPQFVYGLEGMRHCFRPEPPQTKEFQAHKRRATKFNHAVKVLIDSDSSLRFSNLVATITNLYGVTNASRWGSDTQGWHKEQHWFKQQIEQRLRGMEQEVLAHQIIMAINEVNPAVDKQTGDYIPRLSVNADVSVEDDARGTDMYVTLDGVTFPIDIKASERTAQNARKKTKRPHSIITTGISHDELCGNFRVSTKRARRAAPDMLAKLYAARDEFLAQQVGSQQRQKIAA
jgi:hypothetical protein